MQSGRGPVRICYEAECFERVSRDRMFQQRTSRPVAATWVQSGVDAVVFVAVVVVPCLVEDFWFFVIVERGGTRGVFSESCCFMRCLVAGNIG